MPHRTAAILAIGDELTLGQSLDTNSAWLSDQLAAAGIMTLEHVTVPDDRPAIAAAIARLAPAADLLILTGGLGPTEDDLTRPALADALGEPLITDQEALDQIRAWFAGRARPMPGINAVQAQRPPSARCLPNARGTAPGLWVPRPSEPGHPPGPVRVRADIACLPGPPTEMQGLFDAHIRPLLRPARPLITRALHAFGLGESDVATRLADLMGRARNPLVGTTVRGGVVTCRIRFEPTPGSPPAPPNGEPPAPPEVAAVAAAIRERLGPYLFGEGDQTLASALLDLLCARRETLATVESCTGGLLGGAITAIPGCSAIYRGGWVTYTNELKTALVGVPEPLLRDHGAVSREVALAMAAGGLERSGADHCLSITGIAGPDGGTPDKPVGTVWIALASRPLRATASRPSSAASRASARRFLFAGTRDTIRDWSVASALAMLRLRLIGEESLPLLRERRA